MSRIGFGYYGLPKTDCNKEDREALDSRHAYPHTGARLRTERSLAMR